MQITTQDELAEHEIVQTIGLVRGNAVRARHLGKDILAVLRALVGGEVPEYTKMLAESREQAVDRMCAQARALGADGIVAMRLTTSPVMQGAAEILAYGTAVRLRARHSSAGGPPR